jgi:probable rRNA maturation factor
MELDFVNLTEIDFDYFYEKFTYFFNKVVNFLQLKDNFYVEVNIVDNPKIHEINKEYRNIDRPTDVISFAFNDYVEGEITIINNEINVLGEIFINHERAKEQAKDLNQSFDREMCFLFVHGILHLLGYDHMKPEDEEIMYGLQRKIFEGEEL